MSQEIKIDKQALEEMVKALEGILEEFRSYHEEFFQYAQQELDMQRSDFMKEMTELLGNMRDTTAEKLTENIEEFIIEIRKVKEEFELADNKASIKFNGKV